MRIDFITPPQINFVRNLSQQRDVPVAGRSVAEAGLIARYEDVLKVIAAQGANVPQEDLHYVSKREASAVIDWLLTLPCKRAQESRREAPDKLTPGVYEVDGTVYVVKPTRDKQRTYAMRLVQSAPRATEAGTRVDIDFEYDKGAIFKIRAEHRMPFERAKELTVLYSRCIVCGRHLDASRSVEQGIGPVCIKSFPDAKQATKFTGRRKVIRKVYEPEYQEVA